MAQILVNTEANINDGQYYVGQKLNARLFLTHLDFNQIFYIFAIKQIKMPKKITQDDFIKSVKLIHGENIDFSNAVYIKDNIGVECKCNICGNVWWPKPNKLKIGHGCHVWVIRRFGNLGKIKQLQVN